MYLKMFKAETAKLCPNICFLFSFWLYRFLHGFRWPSLQGQPVSLRLFSRCFIQKDAVRFTNGNVNQGGVGDYKKPCQSASPVAGTVQGEGLAGSH